MKAQNPLDKYSSDLFRILIPLANFESFHQTGNELDDEKNFIGRKTIIGKLKNWISNKKTLTGAYLITGYRGMGKSSFVNKVLHDLTHQSPIIQEKVFQAFKCCLILVCLIAYILFDLNHIQIGGEDLGTIPFLIIGLFFWLTGIGIYQLIRYIKIQLTKKTETKGEHRSATNQSIHYIPIHINVGNELISHNDEILRLIIKSLHTKFTDYIQTATTHLFSSYTLLIFQLLLTVTIAENGYEAFVTYQTVNDQEVANTNKAAINSELSTNDTKKQSDKNETKKEQQSQTKKKNNLDKYIIQDYIAIYQSVLFLTLFCLIHILCSKISLLISRHRLFGLTTLKGINHKIEYLYLRCIASIDEENSSTLSHASNKSIFSKKKKYDKASIREMEQLLIEIFDDLYHLREFPYKTNLRFVIVLDELDKIDNFSETTTTADSNLPTYDTSVNGFSGTLNARKRKQELMRTLGNMKYFLSTAKAKFIFIAGRELYDAYLADVSDREFSISSVFDGIININSFFKSDSQSMNITAMTEEYVCQRLLPKNYKGKYTLAEFHKYANKRDKKNFNRNRRNTTFLYQYIMYLVHMSNGSPKKLAVYFEKDIRSYEQLRYDKGYPLEDHFKYYLSFNIKDIAKIGFMHYLTYPIMQAMIGKSKIYEDKLLLSTSFMINHIYKFHNTGFSWRNLEYSPELLDMNKLPELRNFLGTIISILGQEHLCHIQTGLYLFKFPMSISEEIGFLSRRVEDISALFHFSKDESLPIKKHYVHLLNYYTQSNNKIENEELNNLASIHNVLGDLYQADEDFSLAINEYQIGLQLIEKQIKTENCQDLSMSNILFFVRNMLKLGLAYEKRKTFDTAYTVYNELFQKIINYHLVITNNNSNSPQPPKTNYSIIKEDYPLEENHTYPIEKNYPIEIHKSFFENIRLTYLPIIAKLFVLEKINKEGIEKEDLDLAINEIETLTAEINEQSKKEMILADFYQKVGTILYYKNDQKKLKGQDDLYYQKSISYLFNILSIPKERPEPSNLLDVLSWITNNHYKEAIDSQLLLLADTLKGYGNVQLGNSNNDRFSIGFLKTTFENLENFYYQYGNKLKYEKQNFNKLEKAILSYVAAGILYDKGGNKRDSLLMFSQILNTLNIYLRVVRYDTDENKQENYIKDIKDCLKPIRKMVNMMISILYEHNDSINALEIIRLKDILGKDLDEDIKLRRLPLSPDIEELIYKYYSLEIRCEDTSIIKNLYKSSLMGHYRQINTLSQDIHNLRFKFFLNESIVRKICGISRYNQISTKKESPEERLDLQLFTQIYEYFSVHSDLKSVLKNDYNIEIEDNSFESKMDVLNYFVVDNLACLSNISNMLQPLNNPKIFVSYFLGDINLYLEFWKRLYDGLYLIYKNADKYAQNGSNTDYDKIDCGEETNSNQSYEELKGQEIYKTLYKYIARHKDSNCSVSKKIKSYLETKVTGVGYERLSWNYNAEMMLINYKKAQEMHSQGRTYKEMITSLHFLDDDLNNDSLQQNLAIERYLISSQNLEARIKHMHKNIKNSRVFDIKNYI